MKKQSLLLAFLFGVFTLSAQERPDIEGDLILCPNTNGTAYVTNPVFDTYQWYFRYWFPANQPFVPIEGATFSTFTYDWYTYDQAQLKVVATLNGQTLESDTIQIDSYNWASMTIMWDESTPGLHYDWDNNIFFLESGYVFPLDLQLPYSQNIQWYKDSEIIQGANNSHFEITGPGLYYVSAGPNVCPDNIASSPVFDVQAYVGTNNIEVGSVNIYPNPAEDYLILNSPANEKFEKFTLSDLSGRVLQEGPLTSSEARIDIISLKPGTYLMKMEGEHGPVLRKIMKK